MFYTHSVLPKPRQFVWVSSDSAVLPSSVLSPPKHQQLTWGNINFSSIWESMKVKIYIIQAAAELSESRRELVLLSKQIKPYWASRAIRNIVVTEPLGKPVVKGWRKSLGEASCVYTQLHSASQKRNKTWSWPHIHKDPTTPALLIFFMSLRSPGLSY